MTAVPRRPLAIAGLVLLGGLLTAALWMWQGAGASTLASEGRAVAEFRERAGAPRPARTGVPAPGVYLFRQTGSESAGGGPIEVSRDLPPRALYVVSPIPGGYHESLRFSEEHVEEVDFRVSPEGTRALRRRTKVTFLGIGEDSREAQTPPPLDHPLTLAPGATWSGAYRSGDTPVRFRSRVTGRETVTVGGRVVPVVVIRTDSTVGGATPGTRRDEIRWAPGLSLPVRWSIAQDYGGDSPFRMSATLHLEATAPLT